MIRYIVFNRPHKSIFANYKFYKNVKYRLKDEDSKYYFTIKNVKLPKKLEYDLYQTYDSIV